ncbi:SDR family oxidoreductase [Paenibacillus nasutitermitis]|uniref:Short-chain dehydrogenase n=1 Tax=Paenibacillus nasutitermitis TaxID=1652958 RepID=A0A916YMV2_9BACL|nr:SDR family oxidoreductase [Paenibacillus nasutitermitis]GGD52161.1 short-chain dehydrogenase [Paenibacillus nasutitermitis]
MATKWSVRGKYVVITGVTSGIGLAAVKELASLGANLGIIARNQAKANEVAAQIKASTSGNITVDVFLADMSSQQSIRKVAADILAKCPRVDMLINNAGAMFETRQLTIDGIEMTWAVNHLAPFLLTTLLLDRLKESGKARIITTVSDNHMMAKKGINFDDLSAEHLYRFPKRLMGGPTYRYGETKLASILFTLELARRLEGSEVTAHCFHPGLVATNFNKNNGIMARLTMSVMKMFSISPEKGAETLIWLANTDEIPGHSGKYYTDMKLGAPSVPAQDVESAKRLWEISEKQIRATEK